MGVLRKLDVGLSTDGRWCVYPPTAGDPKPIEVLIARWGNEAFERAQFNTTARRATKKHPSFDKNRESVRKAASRHIIKGWKHMELGPDTGDVEYSPQKAFEVISDPRYDAFYEWVIEEALEDGEFAEIAKAELLEKSGSSSAGK